MTTDFFEGKFLLLTSDLVLLDQRKVLRLFFCSVFLYTRNLFMHSTVECYGHTSFALATTRNWIISFTGGDITRFLKILKELLCLIVVFEAYFSVLCFFLLFSAWGAAAQHWWVRSQRCPPLFPSFPPWWTWQLHISSSSFDFQPYLWQQ